MSQSRPVIADRVKAFIFDPTREEFSALARDAFAFQYERIEGLRKLCRQRGVEPSTLEDWRRIPPVPALAFKTLPLATRAGGETFRSSGTSGRPPSVHRHGFLDLYRATIDASFPAACLAQLERPPILSLIADRARLPDSSLSFMTAHVLERWGAEDSLTAAAAGGVRVSAARSFLAARQRDLRPPLILATAFALAQLLEALRRLELRFRLPPGSVLFETGGYKGRTRELQPDKLSELISEHLALPDQSVVREYGMTELTSQFYTRALRGGDPHRFHPEHWVRVRILDPISLAEVPAGKQGLICVFDLANLSSAVHLLTEDLGVAEGDGFRFVGRAAGAELRGCSLASEELAAASD